MKILITGAAGQLGSVITAYFGGRHQVISLTRRELDITRHAAVMETVARLKPAVVINCASYNDVDAAEDDPVAALETNAFAVRSLACAAGAAGAVLVHYSTDFVFQGDASRPYSEEDPTNPRSFYALSKLMGEWLARHDSSPWPAGFSRPYRYYILRVESLFGGPAARSSMDKIISGIEEAREVRVFADRWVSPSYVADVAAATRHLLECGAPSGLYHCVNSGYASWLELAGEAARLLGRQARLTPISVSDVRLRARRPQFCALSNAKLQATGFTMPPWQDALARYLRSRSTARST